MCLAVPGHIQHIQEDDLRTATVSFAGVTKNVSLIMVPEAQVGDYVIVHVGFAISILDEQAAQTSLAMIETLDQDSTDRTANP